MMEKESVDTLLNSLQADAPVRQPGRLREHSGRELAEWLRSPRILEASIGMAAFNALLEVDESACTNLNAEEVIVQQGAGRRVAVVGHFPFVEHGVDAVSGTKVVDVPAVLRAVGEGATFRQIPGKRLLTMVR